MRASFRVFFLLLSSSLLACPKKDPPSRDEIEKTNDKTPTTPSSSASASTSSAMASSDGGVPLADLAGRCTNGSFAPYGSTGTGAGAGGWGDGIGLGTVGGFGHGAGTGTGMGYGSSGGAPAMLKGSVSSVDGTLEPASASKTICASFSSFKSCFDAEAGSDAGFHGNMSLQLGITVSDDGHVKSVSPAIDLGVPVVSLADCLTTAAKALTFDKPPAGEALLGYAFDYTPKSAHATKTVKMIETGTSVKGPLPPEVIRRIIRANFARFRACYEVALKRDPGSKGTVAVKLVIDTTGAVESAVLAPGTLSDASMQGCVLGVYRTLSFPEPEGGKVEVTYPIDFENED